MLYCSTGTGTTAGAGAGAGEGFKTAVILLTESGIAWKAGTAMGCDTMGL